MYTSEWTKQKRRLTKRHKVILRRRRSLCSNNRKHQRQFSSPCHRVNVTPLTSLAALLASVDFHQSPDSAINVLITWMSRYSTILPYCPSRILTYCLCICTVSWVNKLIWLTKWPIYWEASTLAGGGRKNIQLRVPFWPKIFASTLALGMCKSTKMYRFICKIPTLEIPFTSFCLTWVLQTDRNISIISSGNK